MSGDFPKPGSPIFRRGIQSWWSTQYMEPGAVLEMQQYRLFTASIGSTGQGKSKALDIGDTNLKEAGHIGVGASFNVRSVIWEVMHPDPAFRAAVVQSAAWAWDFLQVVVDGTPLTFRPLVDEVVAPDDVPPVDLPATRGGADFSEDPVCMPAGTWFGILLGFGQSLGAEELCVPSGSTTRRVVREPSTMRVRAQGWAGFMGKTDEIRDPGETHEDYTPGTTLRIRFILRGVFEVLAYDPREEP